MLAVAASAIRTSLTESGISRRYAGVRLLFVIAATASSADVPRAMKSSGTANNKIVLRESRIDFGVYCLQGILKRGTGIDKRRKRFVAFGRQGETIEFSFLSMKTSPFRHLGAHAIPV
jgi:hypothetical protein